MRVSVGLQATHVSQQPFVAYMVTAGDPNPGEHLLSEVSCDAMKSMIVSGGPVSRGDYRYGGKTIGLGHVVSPYHGDNHHLRVETLHPLLTMGFQKSVGITVFSAGEVPLPLPSTLENECEQP